MCFVLLIGVFNDAYHPAAFGLEVLGHRGKRRQLFFTGWAPGAPEIDHRDLALCEETVAADRISVQVCRIEADDISCFQGFLPLRRPEGKHGAQGIFVMVQIFKFCEVIPHVFTVFVHE